MAPSRPAVRQCSPVALKLTVLIPPADHRQLHHSGSEGEGAGRERGPAGRGGGGQERRGGQRAGRKGVGGHLEGSM